MKEWLNKLKEMFICRVIGHDIKLVNRKYAICKRCGAIKQCSIKK